MTEKTEQEVRRKVEEELLRIANIHAKGWPDLLKESAGVVGRDLTNSELVVGSVALCIASMPSRLDISDLIATICTLAMLLEKNYLIGVKDVHNDGVLLLYEAANAAMRAGVKKQTGMDLDSLVRLMMTKPTSSKTN